MAGANEACQRIHLVVRAEENSSREILESLNKQFGEKIENHVEIIEGKFELNFWMHNMGKEQEQANGAIRPPSHGDKIDHEGGDPEDYGTLGGFVQDRHKVRYATTCYHVLACVPETSNYEEYYNVHVADLSKLDSDTKKQTYRYQTKNKNYNKLGMYWKAKFNQEHDFALVKTDFTDVEIIDENNFLPKKDLHQSILDEPKGQKVQKIGAATGHTTGRLTEHGCCSGDLVKNAYVVLNNETTNTENKERNFSDVGDSGSIVRLDDKPFAYIFAISEAEKDQDRRHLCFNLEDSLKVGSPYDVQQEAANGV